MYIHRIVIDANCINLWGNSDAMNTLEAYHDAGLIEILKTHTLVKEFSSAPARQEKAKKYRIIGGSSHPDSYFGAVPDNSSRYYQYYKEIFRTRMDEKSERNSLRDCLHIDQALLNNCNYFVTTEKRLQEAGKNIQEIQWVLDIVSPEECLAKLQSYFEEKHGSSEFEYLVEKLNSVGTIIFGANHCNGLMIIDPIAGETLLSCWIEDNSLIVEGKIRDDLGNLMLEIKNGEVNFQKPGAYLKASGGIGPISLGDKNFSQIYIGMDTAVFISARLLSSGRVMFDRVNLHSKDGQRKLVVFREVMSIEGLSLIPS